jgi:endonuclease YncB( thermonuclease family)
MTTGPRRVLLTLISLVAGLLVLAGTGSPAHAADRDCGDFDTQAAAQRFFLNNNPGQDPHGLDAEGDGIACESNPCPCLFDRNPGGDGDSTATTTKRRLTQSARVVRVVDGDTVKVRLGSGRRRDVRLIGIDTPEVYGTVECGGPAASRSLKQMLPRGTRVRLVSDVTQDRSDRYGRLLRYVSRTKDGRDMNRAQLWKGHARVYVYGGDPFERVAGYRKAQRQAKGAPRGLWTTC